MTTEPVADQPVDVLLAATTASGCHCPPTDWVSMRAPATGAVAAPFNTVVALRPTSVDVLGGDPAPPVRGHVYVGVMPKLNKVWEPVIELD